MDKQTILCIDDEIDNLDALERLFRSKYKVLRATSGPEALQVLDQHRAEVAVIITDQRMPQMTGVEFLERSLAISPDSIRILLTGYTDMESIVSAINAGQIYRYINKPWDPIDFIHTVEKAIERYNLSSELKEKNVALSKALSELQSLDSAKNQFMILINHELKTPLTSILSFSSLLLESKLDDEQNLCAQRIKKSSERLKDLVDDVLLIVAGEMKNLKLNVQTFDLQGLNPKLKDEQNKILQQKNLQLDSQLPSKRVVGDQAFLGQVINRLIHNALKFSKEGSTIEVKTTPTPHSHRLRISVTNRGPAIAPAVLEKIFKPFYLDEDVMHHSTGTGLGLTVCQEILSAHGGRLEITNQADGVEAAFELACL